MRRVVIEDLCEHGNTGMHDHTERALFPGCPGGSRNVLDGPTDEMVERAAEAWKEARQSPIVNLAAARAALSAALGGDE
jgi:hypothetical protein